MSHSPNPARPAGVRGQRSEERGLAVTTRSRVAVVAVVWSAATAWGLTVQMADDTVGENYRLGVVATAPAAALAAGELRLILDRSDEQHYYYLRLKGDQAQFFRVEDGRVTPIGTRGRIRRGSPAERLALVVHRQDWSLVLVCNQVVCVRAEDRSLPPGAVGRGVEGKGLSFGAFTVQPTEDIYFSDDFMRSDEQTGAWNPLLGKWQNNQQGSKSSRSANAFSYRAVGDGPSLAVAGFPFWSDYAAQAAVRCDGTGAVGLAVGVQDAHNYFLLRWTAARSADGGTCRLQRVFQDRVTDLTPPVPGGFAERGWYKLQLALAGGHLFAWIDDTPVLEAAVEGFGEGLVGLYEEPGPDDKPDVAGSSPARRRGVGPVAGVLGLRRTARRGQQLAGG